MRKIIHVDMDCFYAAVEMRDRPELRGRPIAVGGSPEGRGVISTANYEARKFGVRSAMASVTALRLCPELVIVRPNFAKYKSVSRAVREIFSRYTSQIEPLSLDEAYLDVTENTTTSATQIAEEIRQAIQAECHLTASAGVASNKFLAKIASDINKPNGLKVIRPHEVEAFMKTLPIEKIWGVGKVTAARMREQKIFTCGDLQKYSILELTSTFGSRAAQLYDFARGIDDRPLSMDRSRKSLSVEETYAQDLMSLEECLEKLPELFDDWNERMIRYDDPERIRGIAIKLKFHDFQGLTRDRVTTTYPTLTDFTALIKEALAEGYTPVRLIGIGVRLEGETQTRMSGQLKLF